MANEKVAVITGASHGIGLSLVAAYRQAGYNVVANALSIGASTDPSVINVAGDIGDPATRQGPNKSGRKIATMSV